MILLACGADGTECLIEISNDVIDMLEPDGDAYHLRRHSGRPLFAFRELLMRRGSRVDDKGLGVTDIREMTGELQRIDDLLSLGQASLDAKRYDSSEVARAEILLRICSGEMVLQPGIPNPVHERRFPKPSGKRESVLTMAFSAEGERFQSLYEQECVERREACPQVSQLFNPGFDDERDIAEGTFGPEGLGEFQAVIAGTGYCENGKPAIVPREFPGIDNHATDLSSVTSYPHCG